MTETEAMAKLGIHAAGKFGLLDVQDALWLGDDVGPWRCDNLDVAALAAEARALELGWPLARVAVAEFGPDDALRLRDEVPTCKRGIRYAKQLLRGTLTVHDPWRDRSTDPQTTPAPRQSGSQKLLPHNP